VLAFELANRTYFAASISDRGDDFFAQFAEQHRMLLDEQKAGDSAYHLLVDENQNVVGRFNLRDLAGGTAEVGYRVAQHVSGRGVATAGVRELCRVAAKSYGLRSLTASVSDGNVASQRVLIKAGFVAVGPTEVAGRPGALYELTLPYP
jgi:[ribosomal protein S5]-alanine N-acetyltransferase